MPVDISTTKTPTCMERNDLQHTLNCEKEALMDKQENVTYSRTKRKAAIEAERKIRQDALKQVFVIETTTTKPPLHAWDWDSINNLFMSESYLISSPRVPLMAEENQEHLHHTDIEDIDIEEAELSWDNSPEQISMQSTTDPFLPLNGFSPKPSFSTTSSNDDEVFMMENPTKFSSRVKRTGAFRKHNRVQENRFHKEKYVTSRNSKSTLSRINPD